MSAENPKKINSGENTNISSYDGSVQSSYDLDIFKQATFIVFERILPQQSALDDHKKTLRALIEDLRSDEAKKTSPQTISQTVTLLSSICNTTQQIQADKNELEKLVRIGTN